MQIVSMLHPWRCGVVVSRSGPNTKDMIPSSSDVRTLGTRTCARAGGQDLPDHHCTTRPNLGRTHLPQPGRVAVHSIVDADRPSGGLGRDLTGFRTLPPARGSGAQFFFAHFSKEGLPPTIPTQKFVLPGSPSRRHVRCREEGRLRPARTHEQTCSWADDRTNVQAIVREDHQEGIIVRKPKSKAEVQKSEAQLLSEQIVLNVAGASMGVSPDVRKQNDEDLAGKHRGCDRSSSSQIIGRSI